MKTKLFEGSGVAIITPFDDTNQVNYSKFEELIEWHIKESTDAIIVCGTTGEAATLPISEHKKLIKFCVDTVNHRIPVIAGTGSNDTRHSINTSQYAESVGVDGILSVVPYYNKTTQKGLYMHFETIAKNVKVPMILYNVPGRTGLDMSPKIVYELSKIDSIVGIKECNFSHIGVHRKWCSEDFSIYSGEDANILASLAMGAQGVISVMANIIPKDTHEICEAFFSHNIDKARFLQLNALELIDALFVETSPSPIKKAMNLLGMEVGGCRLPLVPMELKNQSLLIDALKNYGLL